MVTGTTRVFCVLGHPVAHSVSPAMHNAALRELGLNGVYVAFDVAPENLSEAVRGLRALGVGGVNCTIPHKEALLPIVDRLSDDARLIGAVNTLVFTPTGIEGHNTDAPGFLAALRAAGGEPDGASAVVLGAGGSARAVVVALARRGARITLVNRTVGRARVLADHVNAAFPEVPVRVVESGSAALAEAIRAAQLLVNTTSVGMHPHEDELPELPLDAVHPGLFCFDLIYNPLETRLLREIRTRGGRGSHGAGMLAHQGALALTLWTGHEAPAALMEQIVLQSLSR